MPGPLIWDAAGERIYETGVDHGVLYNIDADGKYSTGVPWNGLTNISESPSGAEASPIYADNIKYLNLISAEEFGATIEAFMYPAEFERCDGTAEISPGVTIGQQRREIFGFSYRTLIGNDLVGTDLGYKLHLVYGALAAPSEKGRATVNETPEAVPFSWEITTTAIKVPGFKPSATITVDSRSIPKAKLEQLEDILYGTATVGARLPDPEELIEILGASAAPAARFASDGFTESTDTAPPEGE